MDYVRGQRPLIRFPHVDAGRARFTIHFIESIEAFRQQAGDDHWNFTNKRSLKHLPRSR